MAKTLIARLMSKWPQLKVRAATLVAPAETQGTDRLGHFGPIREAPLGVRSLVVARQHDPWMRYSRAVGWRDPGGRGSRTWGLAVTSTWPRVFVLGWAAIWLRDELLGEGAAPALPSVRRQEIRA